jgi:hypothetical protein
MTLGQSAEPCTLDTTSPGEDLRLSDSAVYQIGKGHTAEGLARMRLIWGDHAIYHLEPNISVQNKC